MKNFIFYCCVLLVLPGLSFGQKYSLGVVAKTGISQVIYSSDIQESSSFDVSNKYRFAYAGGIFGQLRISPRSAFGIEVLYRRQNGLYIVNSDVTDTFTLTHVISTTKNYTYVDYIGVPVNYLYYIGSITLHVGAQANFAISQKGKVIYDATVNGALVHDEYTTDTLNFEKIDAGLSAGIHYNITPFFYVGIDYYLGFANLIPDTGLNVGAQNQNIAASFGFRLLPVVKKPQEFYTH